MIQRFNGNLPYIPKPDTADPLDQWNNNGGGGGGTDETVTISGGGLIIIPGFGPMVGGSRPGAEKYYSDIRATDVATVKNIFVQMQADGDPRLQAWMKDIGVTDVKVAQEIWDDGATYAWSLASGGKQINLVQSINTPNFQKNYLSIPKSLITGAGGGGGGGGAQQPAYYTSLTDPDAAKAKLKKNMMLIAGRQPTAAEAKEFAVKLNAAEKKATTKVTYKGTRQTTQQSEFDGDAFLLEYIIKKTDFKTLQSGDAKGVLDGLTTLVSDYGIESAIGEAQKIALAKQWLTGVANETTVRQQLSKTAASYFPAFAEALKAKPTASLKDVASDYISVYSNILEVDADTVSIKDALSKAQINNNGKYETASLFDYEKTLRKTEKYQYTKQAHAEAASFGAAFARSMGVSV